MGRPTAGLSSCWPLRGRLVATKGQFIPRPASLVVIIEGTRVINIKLENWQGRALVRTMRAFKEKFQLSNTGLAEALTAIMAVEAAAHGEEIENGEDED